MRKSGLLLLVGLSLGLSLPGAATKPCPPDRCGEGSAFSAKTCRGLSTWVAVGRIEAVEHHPNGAPIFKDFAEFTFRITRWEKGARPVETIRFQVGWCDNVQPPPEDLSRLYRIYGADEPVPPGKDKDPGVWPHYLHIEPAAP